MTLFFSTLLKRPLCVGDLGKDLSSLVNLLIHSLDVSFYGVKLSLELCSRYHFNDEVNMVFNQYATHGAPGAASQASPGVRPPIPRHVAL